MEDTQPLQPEYDYMSYSSEIPLLRCGNEVFSAATATVFINVSKTSRTQYGWKRLHLINQSSC